MNSKNKSHETASPTEVCQETETTEKVVEKKVMEPIVPDEGQEEAGQKTDVHTQHMGMSAKAISQGKIVKVYRKDIVLQDNRLKNDHRNFTQLKRSIRKQGIIIPLICSHLGDETVGLVDGELRLRIAEELGIDPLPVLILEGVDCLESLILGYVINNERNIPNPMAEAEFFRMLHEEHGLTYKAVARKVNKTGASISLSLKLLNLTENVQQLVREKKLPAATGRLLLDLNTEAEQEDFAEEAIEKGESVKQLQSRISKYLKNAVPPAMEKPVKVNPDPDIEGLYIQDPNKMTVEKESKALAILDFPRKTCVPEATNKDFHSCFQENKDVLSKSAESIVPGGVMVVIVHDGLGYHPQLESNIKGLGIWTSMGSTITAFLQRTGLYLANTIYWDKVDEIASSGQYVNAGKNQGHTEYSHLNQVEHIMIFRKEGKRDNVSKKLRDKSLLTDLEWETMRGNAWKIKPSGCRYNNSALQLPEEIVHRLIKLLSFEEDEILIPWVNDGIVLKVARDLNRKAIGYTENWYSKNVIMETLGMSARIQSVPEISNSVLSVDEPLGAKVGIEAAGAAACGLVHSSDEALPVSQQDDDLCSGTEASEPASETSITLKEYTDKQLENTHTDKSSKTADSSPQQAAEASKEEVTESVAIPPGHWSTMGPSAPLSA